MWPYGSKRGFDPAAAPHVGKNAVHKAVIFGCAGHRMIEAEYQSGVAGGEGKVVGALPADINPYLTGIGVIHFFFHNCLTLKMSLLFALGGIACPDYVIGAVDTAKDLGVGNVASKIKLHPKSGIEIERAAHR